MPLRPITITHADRGWHEAFLEFVPRVFPGIGFRDWYEHGGWTDDYVVFALADGDRIVASASRMEMRLVLQGRDVRGFQLGAVGTVPEHRHRGHQAAILPRLLAGVGASDLAFLFANDSVLDFYPRFGFERVRESVFRADHVAHPQGEPLRALALDSAADRALLQRVAASAAPVTALFGARDYGSIVLWYWANFFRNGLRYAPDHDAIVVADQQHDLLRIHDVLSAAPLDLASYVPRLISARMAEVELGFTPGALWPGAVAVAEYTESPLFVRGRHALPAQPFKFPTLAQT